MEKENKEETFLLPCPWVKRAALFGVDTVPLTGNSPGSAYRVGRRSGPVAGGGMLVRH